MKISLFEHICAKLNSFQTSKQKNNNNTKTNNNKVYGKRCKVLHVCVCMNVYMYIASKLCKMRCPLNLVLEILTYFLFYSTLLVVILLGGLKLPKLLIHTLIMSSEMSRNTWNHCLKFSLPFIFHYICYGKSEVKIFSMVIKVKLVVSKASNICFKSFDFFQMLLASPN